MPSIRLSFRIGVIGMGDTTTVDQGLGFLQPKPSVLQESTTYTGRDSYMVVANLVRLIDRSSGSNKKIGWLICAPNSVEVHQCAKSLNTNCRPEAKLQRPHSNREDSKTSFETGRRAPRQCGCIRHGDAVVGPGNRGCYREPTVEVGSF